MLYLDMVKGRLYTAGKNSIERRSAQTAMYEALDVLTRLMSPILVFTAEDIWKYLPKSADNNFESVHLASWPLLPDKNEAKNECIVDMDTIMGIIPEITKLLEEKRAAGLIGSSFDAKIKLLTNSQVRYKFLASLKNDLLEIFKVSQVELEKIESLESFSNKSVAWTDTAIEIYKAEGEKCPRCWNYSLAIGKSVKHPLICDKCEAAIEEEKAN